MNPEARNGAGGERPESANGEGATPEICIAVDIRGISRASIEAMVVLAERIQWGLVGLFVEDLLLQQVAELPFTTEVVRSTGEERDLHAPHLRQHSQQLARALRGLFDECALARQVGYRSEVREQRVPVSVLVEQASGLYLPGKRQPGRPGRAGVRRVKVLTDGGGGAHRALDMVRALVEAGLCREVILVNMGLLPARLPGELSARGARVQLLNEHREQSQVLRHIVDGPEADLVLVPRPLVRGIDERVLQAACDNSASGGTLLVS